MKDFSQFNFITKCLTRNFIINFQMDNKDFNQGLGYKKYRKVGPYLLSNVIGRGAYSTVYEARKQGDKKRYAVKQISLFALNAKQIERIHIEIKVLTEIKHKNIVCLLDYKQTSRNLYLVFEYCKHTDLEKYVQNYHVDKLSQDKVKKIAIQIKNAFQVLRVNKVVHRDLKLANILVTEDFEIKIADFGFAKYLDDDEFFKSYVGTPLTMAPQIMENRSYNEKCDLWSLGIMLYQLLFGKNPFFTKDRMTKTELKNAIKGQLKIPNQISSNANDLLKKLIVWEPNERISFQDFFKHPWILDEGAGPKINEDLLQEALRAQLNKILIVCNRKKDEKQFLQTKAQNLLSYEIIENVKNAIENKIMTWINLTKKIMSMSYENDKLSFLGVAVLMQNIQKCQNNNFFLYANESKKIALYKYNDIRKLQKWQMSQFTKRFPGFMERSWQKLLQYMNIMQKTKLKFKDKQLDAKLDQLFLLELTSQIVSQFQNKDVYQDLIVFTKIRPFGSSDLHLKITSSLINDNTIDMLLRKMTLNIENNKIYKKLIGIFKLQTLHKDYPQDRIYQNFKQLLD